MTAIAAASSALTCFLARGSDALDRDPLQRERDSLPEKRAP